MRILSVKAILFLLLAVALFTSCGENSRQSEITSKNEIKEASLLQMQTEKDYTVVTISDPWSKSHGKVLHRYILIERGKPLPDGLPDGTVVRVPLDSALVYSSVHTGIFAELGAQEAVTGVVDAQYFNDDFVATGIAQGKITDCGSSMNPTIEKVISMHADAILLSPYQDATYGQVTKLGVPIIECADYMETTPLGRAEWVKFYGALVGARERADSLFEATVRNYNEIKNEVAGQVKQRPMVLTESVISGIWNVPGGKSYMALLIQDAGGDYPWADDEHTGSLSLDINQVLAKAQKADVWLIKSIYIHNLADLKSSHALNEQFLAYKTGKVYVCDTGSTHFFDRFPFHPDVLLKEYATIFHPSLFGSAELRFFKPMTE